MIPIVLSKHWLTSSQKWHTNGRAIATLGEPLSLRPRSGAQAAARRAQSLGSSRAWGIRERQRW